MKTYKKLGFLFCLLLLALGFVFGGKKVSAITPSDFNSPPADYTLVFAPNPTSISATLGDKTPVTFNVGLATATPLVFTPSTTQFTNFTFCSGTNISVPGPTSNTATINAKWIVNPLPGQNCNTVALRIFTYTGTINLTNPQASGAAATTTNSCEASFNFGFEWLFCPILRGIDDFVSKVNNFVDGQLNFNVRQNLQDPPGIKQVWSIFRIIASAVLVILMLVMVLSQAVSIGPFDAYTVRKLLPRLIAAVILIQLSWSIAIYAIEFANDLGRGIVGLLTVPFGGKDQLGLDQLIGKLGQATPGIFVAGSLFAIVAAVLINPFGAIMLAFVALVAVIAALGTLLVRDALIVASVIFLPMAFLAWILPGTQKYWKLLWDNFVKALLLFPIIAGLIYVGRIFAWIVANSSGTPGILDLFAIVIGFFGPYFLLPKAFRWGGNIMSTASKGIATGVNKVGGERGRKYLQTRQEELNKQRGISSANRLRQWDQNKFSRRQKLGSIIRGDKFKSGDWDPAYKLIPIGKAELRRQQEEKTQRFRAQSIRAENEEREYAKQKLEEEASHAMPGNRDGYYKKVWLSGLNENDYDTSDPNSEEAKLHASIVEAKKDVGHRSESERFAALEMAAIEGGESGLEFLQKAAYDTYDKMYDPVSGKPRKDVSQQVIDENATMDKLMGRNTGAFFAKMPHLPYYKGAVRAAEGFKPEDITTLSATATHRILDELQTSAAAGDTRAANALNSFYTAYQLAATSDTTNRRISFQVRKEIEDSLSKSKSLASPDVMAGVAAASASGYAPTPGELRVQHEQVVGRTLPTPSTIVPSGAGAPPNPNLESFKLQIQGDRGIQQVLAQGMAYGTLSPEHVSALASVRSDIEKTINDSVRVINNPASAEADVEQAKSQLSNAKSTWNNIATEIQQAHLRRINEQVDAAAAKGYDAARHRDYAQERVAPEVIALEPNSPPPTTGPDLRKFE